MIQRECPTCGRHSELMAEASWCPWCGPQFGPKQLLIEVAKLIATVAIAALVIVGVFL